MVASLIAVASAHLDIVQTKAESIGPEAVKAAEALKAAVIALDAVIAHAAETPRPSDVPAVLNGKMTPVFDQTSKVAGILAGRTKVDPGFIKLVEAAMESFNWVFQATPVPFISEYLGTAQFSGNKLLTNAKASGKTDEQDYVKALYAFFKEMIAFVKENHTTGLAWKVGGAAAPKAATGGAEEAGTDTCFKVVCANVEKWAAEVDPIVVEGSKLLTATFVEHGATLARAAAITGGRPDSAKFGEFLQPLADKMNAVGDFCTKNNRNKNFLFLEILRDVAALVAWISCADKPVPFLKDNTDVVQFTLNKLLNQDKKNKEWVGAIKTLCSQLIAYVTENHKACITFGGGAQLKKLGGGDDAAPAGAFADVVKLFKDLVPLAGKCAAEPDLVTLTNHLVDIAVAEDAFLAKASLTAKPATDDAAKAASKDVTDKLEALNNYVAKNNRHKTMFQHMSTVQEASSLFCWISAGNLPGPYAEGQFESFDFYTNKLLTGAKGKTEELAWIRGLKAATKSVVTCVKAEYKTGVTWSMKPAVAGGAAPPPPPPGKKLPPPPPPPPPPAPSASSGGSSSAGGADAMFAEIRAKGTDITKALKHVDDKQKVYKQENREVRTVTSNAPKKKKHAFVPVTGTARTELEGNKKWTVEYHVGDDEEHKLLEITQTDRSHGVNIRRCMNAYVKIVGKVNSINIVECASLQLEIDSTVGPIDMTTSTSVEILVKGTCPSVICSKVNGLLLHLSDDSFGADIVTTCSNAVNVTYPIVDEDGNADTAELPIPEIFTSKVNGNRIKTTAVEHGS